MMRALQRIVSIFCLTVLLTHLLCAQVIDTNVFKASNSTYRNWWDVQHYSIDLIPDISTHSLRGSSVIQSKLNTNWSKLKTFQLQIDLQAPLTIDSCFFEGVRHTQFKRVNDAVYLLDLTPEEVIQLNQSLQNDSVFECAIYYSGKPKIAKNPPWDGGLIWSKDAKNRDWIGVACQSVGAGIWFPCKDIEYDEPNHGVELTLHVPKGMMGLSNGRLIEQKELNLETVFKWKTVSPINIYDITFDIGYYLQLNRTIYFNSIQKNLDIQLWLIDYEVDKFDYINKELNRMFASFEQWFGPYPFIVDGYQLIQTPFLGMEHQSAIAYGNDFQFGYRGKDLSKTGWGLKFDFILVHESGHEWFGNAISSYDIADMWIHEAFTTYSEALFLETYYGKSAAEEYVRGIRCKIKNDIPIIGQYNQRQEGSGDMYFKGANLIQLYREVLNDDEKFKKMLLGMQQFWYKTTTSEEVVQYMCSYLDDALKESFQLVFKQYLTTIQIPQLEIKKEKGLTYVKWGNCIPGFSLPLKLKNGTFIYPTTEWKAIKKGLFRLKIDPNFYVELKA